jgi:bifunctional DNA-binding transcriptional regulator/antitoxin component of YhaV-PrlF toxin-antitoxin module
MRLHAVSRLTSKSQTTIPREVREMLSLGPGDVIVYDIAGDEVRLRKGSPLDVSYLRAWQTTLSEWDSPDAAAYDALCTLR